MQIKRRKTKVIKIGRVTIGGDNPVAIQSMAKVKTSDVKGVLRQLEALKKSGCEIVRLAVKDNADAAAIKTIKKNTGIALVADIHFDWRLAIEAINSGIDKIRLNPGNIYKKEQVKEIVCLAKARHIPIRVGLNSGSLPQLGKSVKTKDISQRMCFGALSYIRTLEGFGFFDIVVSLKASNIMDTVRAYRLMAVSCDYPFHLGVTATGLPFEGAIKSSIAVGSLLLDGIGDTIRISLTDRPEQEVRAGKIILKALGLRNFGPEIISCPTCGRCEVDLIKLVRNLESKLSTIDYRPSTYPIKLALMGCVVNGPGEAKEADFGIAFGKKDGLFFKKGKAQKKVAYSNSINMLLKNIEEK